MTESTAQSSSGGPAGVPSRPASPPNSPAASPAGVPAWETPVSASLPAKPEGSSFGQVMALGIVTFLFGVFVLAWPNESVRVLAVLVGLWLIAAGIARIVTAFMPGRTVGRHLLSGVVGVLLLIGGAACLRDVAKGVVVLAMLIGLSWILSGIAELVMAADADGAIKVGLVALAVVSIVIGFVFMVWPSLSLTVLVVLAGVSAIAMGIGEVILALRLRRAI